jgi:hypothetical protein
MKLPITSWVVFIHNQELGTFNPKFPTCDEANEFANAMRLLNDNCVVSEPYPVVMTKVVKEYVNH